MTKFWCAVFIAVLSSSALARTMDGADDEKKAGDEHRVKSLQELTAELEAQSAQLEAQRLQIQALQAKTAAMSLEGNGLPPEPQDKSALPEQVKSKWGMNIYGFVEADFIYDNRQSGALTDGAFNPALPRGQSYATEHGQMTFGARNSRIGFNVNAPEYAGIRASAKLEMDFEGVAGGATAANAGGGAVGSGAAEANATWVNPTFRFRHMYITLDSDYITVQLGQGWELFGWQPYFHPNTVDIQGVPGQVYSRSPKAQFSHKFRGPVDIDIAAALSRPPERDSGTPDIQAGIKLTIPDWVGVHTMGSTGTAIDAAGIGFSALTRAFRVPNPPPAGGAFPFGSDAVRAKAAAADLFLPILHPDKESRANSLSFTGEFAYGAGYSEEYSGFNMGVGAGNGVVGVADQGSIGYLGTDLRAIQLRTTQLGLQYYLPGNGNWWVAIDYGATHSNNIGKLGGAPGVVFAPGAVFKNSQYLNMDLFWDVTPAVRLGLSVDQYRDTYVDEKQARDSRIQFSAFYLF